MDPVREYLMHKEATESAEHKRLVRVLETYADECGYTADGTDVLDIPEIPDVVQFNDAKEMLFVGDAKVSDGPDVPNTLKQIDGYFAAFLNLDFAPGGQHHRDVSIPTARRSGWALVDDVTSTRGQTAPLPPHTSLVVLVVS